MHTPLTDPDRLWTAAEVLAAPCPVPAEPGVYGWHFTAAPHPALPVGRLLYTGIAPRRMPPGRPSRQSLRTRIRYHYRGNAAGSTLRYSLGCLLGLELRRVSERGRTTFGRAGEAELSAWMAEHARVCWTVRPEPWDLESRLIATLDLPLNLAGNEGGGFHGDLTGLRRAARVRAHALPVVR
ncbi:GIY-YIG nuclease family protein [Kitasatospora sp. NPDC004272]